MKKYFLVILLVIFTHLAAKKFNPISPSLHHLIGKSPNDPMVIYFLDKMNIDHQDFLENNYIEINKDEDDFSILMPLDKTLNLIEISINEPIKAKNKYKELLDFYEIPMNYDDFKETFIEDSQNTIEEYELEDEDWEEYGEDLAFKATLSNKPVWDIQEDYDDFGYESDDISNDEQYEEDILLTKTISYSSINSYNPNIMITYAKEKNKNYLLSSIYIVGDFYKQPGNEWEKPSQKHYSKLSKSFKNKIEEMILQAAENRIANNAKQEEATRQYEVRRKIEEEELKAEKEKMITIWDQYLDDFSNIENFLHLFNLSYLVKKDIDDLIEKYGFKNNYSLYYSSNHELDILIYEEENKYYIKQIKFKLIENQELPLLQLNQASSLADLVKQFGSNYYEQSWGPDYVLLASTSDPEGREIDLSIEFYMTYEGKIKTVSFEKTNTDIFKYDGKIYVIENGCTTGDCINGRGIYQFSNGFWVDGVFKEKALIGGTIKKINFTEKDIAAREFYANSNRSNTASKAQNYKTDTTSIWSEYLQSESEKSIFELFNKKNFIDEDWKILQENYFYSKNYDFYHSPDKKTIIRSTSNGSCIKSIQFNIDDVKDMKALGYEKQLSYDELVTTCGHEYIEEKGYYDGILMPKDDFNKKNHLQISFCLNSEYSEVIYIEVKPYYPETIVINDILGFIPPGLIHFNGIDFQWSDGYWFKGQTMNGIPWDGGIYYYQYDTPHCRLIDGKVNNGITPSITINAIDDRDPVLILIDEATDGLNDFNTNKSLVVIYVQNMADDEERANYEENWKSLDQYTREAKENLEESENALYTIINKVSAKDNCMAAVTQTRRMLSGISGLEEFIDAMRQTGLRFGRPVQKDLDVVNAYSGHLESISNGRSNLINELDNCGYFDK